MDVDSLVNILFRVTLEQMGMKVGDLQHIATPLFKFSGHTVHPLSQIRLPLFLGKEPWHWMILNTVTVIEAFSAYNIILGWSILSAFQVVASTFHQKIKFPVSKEVSEVWGDQQVMCKCYVKIIWADQRNLSGQTRLDRQGGCMHEVYTVQEGEPSLGIE